MQLQPASVNNTRQHGHCATGACTLYSIQYHMLYLKMLTVLIRWICARLLGTCKSRCVSLGCSTAFPGGGSEGVIAAASRVAPCAPIPQNGSVSFCRVLHLQPPAQLLQQLHGNTPRLLYKMFWAARTCGLPVCTCDNMMLKKA